MPARSLGARIVRHPLLWTGVCLAIAVPLMGTAFDFVGFLLSLVAGWLAANAVARGLFLLRRRALSLALHVGLSIVAGVALFALAEGASSLRALPTGAVMAVSFAMVAFAGWTWITLIGRVSGAVQADSERRASTLVEPEWQRDAEWWTLRLPAVVLRRTSYVAAVAALAIAAAAVVIVFVVVLDDLAQRMSPLVMVLVLGWVVGLPMFLVLRGVARARTVSVEVRAGVERVEVRRTEDGHVLFDAPVDGIRMLHWASRSAPTRAIVRPDEGPGLVLLFGMARRAKGTATTVPELPARLRRAWEAVGLAQTRTRTGETTLGRAAIRAADPR